MNAAVVTGASMGLGEEYARQLAARGVNLVLVARSAEKLEALASELQGRHQIRAVAMACDLSLPGAAEQVRAFLSERNIHPTWLVNNAGFGLVGGFDAMDFGRVHDMIQLNVAALVELTHKLLPQLRLARDSRIINIASSASFQPIPFFNVYAATKVFVLHFSEALHEELRGTEVRVLCVCPGPTPTKFAENNGLPAKYFEKGQSAQEVVRLSLRASDRRRAMLVCQRGWALFLQRLLPRFIVRYVAGQVARSMLRRGFAEKDAPGK